MLEHLCPEAFELQHGLELPGMFSEILDPCPHSQALLLTGSTVCQGICIVSKQHFYCLFPYWLKDGNAFWLSH